MTCSYSVLRCAAIAAAQSLALLCALTPQADAAVLAQDRFDTYSGGIFGGGDSLKGQSGSPVGFTGSWNSNTANLQVQSSGILDRDLSNGQGKWEPSPGFFSERFRRADRLLSPVSAPPNNTFYMQHLVNAGELRAGGVNQDYAFIGFGSFVAQETIEGTANNLLGAFTGFVDNGQGSIDLVIRSRTGFSPDVVSDTLLVSDAVNVTYNVIMALEYSVNSGGIADEIRYWVDPSDYSNGEAGLDATAVVSGTISGAQLSGPSDMNRLSVMNYGFDRSFFFDESTLATSIDDLLPLAADVPEPASALLVGIAAVSAATRGRAPARG